jgi:hypothetical protein
MRRGTKGDDGKEEAWGPMPAPKDSAETTLEPSFEGVDSDKGISRLEMMGLLGSGLAGTALGFSSNIGAAQAKENVAESDDAGEIQTIASPKQANTKGIVTTQAWLDTVRTSWLWAQSSGTHRVTQTIGIPTRNVMFLIALAKYQGFSGAGHAKAFVRQSCTRSSSDQILCGLADNANTATSAGFIPNCTSITFEVEVNNAYGYGVWVVLYL